MIPQPTDKKIKFQSVLDCGYTERVKARALLEGDSRPRVTPVKIFHRHYAKGFHNAIFKSKKHYLACVEHYERNYKGTTADDIDIRGDNSVYEGIRYINTRESERLQTVPEGYTDCVKPLEALSLLGDGWTVDVIAHIFSFLDTTN